MGAQLPTYFLVVVFAGWLNRQQQAVIEYLQTENEILKWQLKRRRLRLTDEDRCRLAGKGRAFGRKVPAEVRTVRTPPRSPNCSATLSASTVHLSGWSPTE